MFYGGLFWSVRNLGVGFLSFLRGFFVWFDEELFFEI